MNKMSCFLLLAVLAAGCVSKDGTSVYCHPVFYRDDFGDEKYDFKAATNRFYIQFRM